MSDKSAIEWTDATWNPVTGCTKVSPGCDNCYAETFAERFRGVPGHHFTNGFDLTLRPEALAVPRRWKKPRRIFVNSMSDLFHRDVPDEFIARVWMEMLTYRRHTFQILTKRPDRMRRVVKRIYENGFRFISFRDGDGLHRGAEPAKDAPNIWLGVSIESNEYAWRADMLRETPATVRFLSVEPMLGPIDKVDLTGIDWVIVGGESGHGARPMHPEWVRDVRDRCKASGVPFFFKQWGEWADFTDDPTKTGNRASEIFTPGGVTLGVGDGRRGSAWMARVGKKASGRVLDGRTWDEFPAVHA